MGVDQSIDITPEELKTVLALLDRHLPGTAAWVYGSRSKWTSRPQSDLDLVVFATPEQQRQVGDLREAFEESNLPFRVDLFVWDDVPDTFRRQIEDEHSELKAAIEPIDESGLILPESWPVSTFTDAFLINPAVPIKRGVSTPFVGMAAINSSIRAVRAPELRKFRGVGSRFQNGDTLMARITPCLENGKIARFYADSDQEVGHGSTEFIVIRGRPGVTDNDYAFYVTRSPRVRNCAVDQMTGTSGRQRVPVASLAYLRVSLPPLTEQRAIAHILGTLDDKIELNRRMNTTLEAMARALFRSWFVDFDPVRAKMEGRDTGLPQEIADLFPDRLVNSEMGEIPEGWTVAPLRQLLEVNPKRSLQKGQIAPYLPMANMPTQEHAPNSFSARPFGSGTRFANGDTLVSRITPCLENGKIAFVDFLRDNQVGWGSTEYIVLVPRPPLPKYFAYCLARSARFREFAIQNMSGTSGRQRVPVAALKGFLVAAPQAPLSARFDEVAGSLFERANRAGRESRTLAALRDTLLPKLISGEVRVGFLPTVGEGGGLGETP